MGNTTTTTTASSGNSRSNKKNSNNDNNKNKNNMWYTSRKAHHAGTWYSNTEEELDDMLTEYMNNAKYELQTNHKEHYDRICSINNSNNNNNTLLRGIICPHAGYMWSGPTAAYSYYALEQELNKKESTLIKHILVLHPSHHVRLNGCAVSGAKYIETPIGNLIVDNELRNEILNLNSTTTSSCKFTIMEQYVDEQEHSGELQYPYIRKCLNNTNNNNNNNIPILPIMCGNLSNEQEEEYGKLLSNIISREDVLCIISSDFCHWGTRFSYQPFDTKQFTTTNQIYKYIYQLDHEGMNYIELQQPGAFAKYCKLTRNNICGKHPISVWLNAITTTTTTTTTKNNNKDNNTNNTNGLDVSFIRYAQSHEVKSYSDSSVSYASAIATIQK